VWWCKPVIPSFQKVGVEGIPVQGIAKPCLKTKKKRRKGKKVPK
jgi:hypothetical protein